MSIASRRAVATGLIASPFILTSAARAQGLAAWPEKPIKVVVPFPPGGGADYFARVLGPRMTEGLKQPMIVDNRPGAGTSIANDIVAKSQPDGYTLLQVNRDMMINPSIYTSLPYDTLKGFEWIGKGADGPFVMTVNPSYPAKTLGELIALAKAKPGTVPIGNLGIGGIVHLNVEALQLHHGFKFLHVPYKGAGPALAAAMSGEIAVAMTAVTGALPFIRDGKLRALFVGSKARSPLMPDVPTIAEAGGGDAVQPTFFGLAAPAGTPRPIINRLSAEMKRAMAEPDLVEKVTQNGLIAAHSTPEEFAAQVAADVAHFAKLVRAVGIEPQ